MEIFVLLIGLPIIVGLLIAFGTAVLAAFSYIFVGALSLAINFWYITLAVMLVLLAPLIYLNSWLFWILAALVIFFTVAWFLVAIPNKSKQKLNVNVLLKSINCKLTQLKFFTRYSSKHKSFNHFNIFFRKAQ